MQNTQRFVPIVTAYGTLSGRDAIYLDKYSSDGWNLRLKGEINAALASSPPPAMEYLGYEIRFIGVLAVTIMELDTYEAAHARTGWPQTSFDEVEHSSWRASLRGKVKPESRHFVFQTYDLVFDVICERYELEFPVAEIVGA